MRAMAIVDYEKPLELLDLPIPTIKPGWVLVKVLTCGVCYSDYKTSKGLQAFSKSLNLPHVPGHEIAGEVAEAGPETGYKVGDRVVVYDYWSCGHCAYCRMGLETHCTSLQAWVGFTHTGGFQEYLAVPAARLLPLPPSISPTLGAAVSCALGTAYRAVTTRGQVVAGETAVVLGAGGVGLHAMQVARAGGAKVLAVDVDPRKLTAATRLGAAGVAQPGKEAQEMVMAHTDRLGADLILDTVGHSDSVQDCARMARRGGRVVGIGYSRGGVLSILSDDFVLREIQYIGTRYVQRAELERALRLVAQGDVELVVDRVLPLEGANEALALLERGEVVGRVVLQIADF